MLKGLKMQKYKLTSLIKSFIIAAIPVLLLANSVVFGEDTVARLTLKTAIEKALNQNLNLNQYANQVKTNTLNYKQSKQNLLPNLQGSLSSTRRFDKQYDDLTNTTTDHNSNSLSASVQSNLNIFNGFGDKADIEKSGSDLNAIKYNYQREKENIIFETISRYLELIQNAEVIGIEKADLTAQQDQLDRIKEFYETGNKPISDVLQQRADIADAELRVLNAENNYEISRLNLLEILGEMPDQQYEFIAPDSMLVAEIIDSPTVSDFNYETRADWKAEEYTLKGTDYEIDAARSGYWPSVNMSLSAGSNYSSDRTGLGFTNQFNDINPYGTVGISLSLPIFEKFQTHNSVQIAKINKESETLEQEKLRLAIQLDTQQARFDYETAVKQKEAANAKLDYARQSLEVTEARYNVGSSTYVELSQIRASYLSAANDRIQAVYNHLLKRLELSYNYGTIEEMLTNLNLLEN
jgi:outer membrane protein